MAALRAIRDRVFSSRGALVDCKVCGDCWVAGEAEQHGRSRSYAGELSVKPCPMDGVSALLSAVSIVVDKNQDKG